MTQAAFVTTTINQSKAYPRLASVNSGHSVRLILNSARPLLPDNLARRSKVLAAKNIWKQSRSEPTPPAESYLHRLGWTFTVPLPQDVRFHSAVLFEPTREKFPAMISAVRNRDGGFVGIHRTFLTQDGDLLNKPSGDARRMLGNCYGSYVQLAKATAYRLIITETVEMALLIQQACPDLPVWAAMTIGNMKSPVPSSVGEITLCIDYNQKSPDIASKLLMDAAREHIGRGTTVLLAEPIAEKNKNGVKNGMVR